MVWLGREPALSIADGLVRAFSGPPPPDRGRGQALRGGDKRVEVWS